MSPQPRPSRQHAKLQNHDDLHHRDSEAARKKGILSRDDILTELADNLPTDDKLLEEDIKRLATEIGLW
jgi:hypothetical protein